SIQLSRHDHHNIELKTGFDLGGDQSKGVLDLHLFFPGSVQLKTTVKSELLSDFHARARLSFARDTQDHPRLLEPETESLRRRLHEIIQQQNPNELPSLLERAFSETRRLGAVFGETLRGITDSHKRILFLAHSRAAHATDPSAELIDLAQRVGDVAGQLER